MTDKQVVHVHTFVQDGVVRTAAKVLIDELGSSLNLWYIRTFIAATVIYAAISVYHMSPAYHDDTEPPGWGHPSGLTPRTDHLTGCQYLTADGAITPRVDAQGRHLGCRAVSPR